MKIVLASHNPGKMKEMSAILAAFGVELVLQSDLGMHIEVEETGTTFRRKRTAQGPGCDEGHPDAGYFR